MNYDLKGLIDNIHDGVYFVDEDRKIIYWNNAAERITGFTSDEVVGSRCMDNILIHVDKQGNNLCNNNCPLAASITDGSSEEMELYLQHKKGHRVPVLVRTKPLRDKSKKIVGGAEIFTDLSSNAAILQRVEELEQLALLDNLTKLSNRNHIEPALKGMLQEHKRYSLSFGVLFMDIDHFKNFNDTYGHDTGDLVLKTVAATLKSQARSFDLFGRWGGEEFIGLIRNVDLQGLRIVGERCRMLIKKSQIHTESKILTITVSIGATIVQKDDLFDTILKRADKLMYQSKQSGRNCVTID